LFEEAGLSIEAFGLLKGEEKKMSDQETTHPYVKLARGTVERHLRGEHPYSSGTEVDSDEKLWGAQRACFVSIKTRAGDLRGCIGTISPVQPTLDREIIMNAISSSTRDPRFPPMTARELEGVVFSVDILGEPEAVASKSELDPKKWGIIVHKGMRRGVLLPDLEGVDTVERQIEIAVQKAGIQPDSEIAIERFSVDRYREGD
jgi:AmmeMemoRadiSam system protein A